MIYFFETGNILYICKAKDFGDAMKRFFADVKKGKVSLDDMGVLMKVRAEDESDDDSVIVAIPPILVAGGLLSVDEAVKVMRLSASQIRRFANVVKWIWT
jgi:hypothetical protein